MSNFKDTPVRFLGRARARWAVAGAIVVALAGAGTADALSGSPSWNGPSHTAAPVKAAPRVDAAVISQLSVLARPLTAGDALPAADAAELHNGYAYAGPNLAAARRVTASNGETAYLVPANGGVCAVNFNESLCTSAQHIAGSDTVDVCSPDLAAGKIELEWLLPDGASDVHLINADGSTTAMPSGDNVYIADVAADTSLPTTIAWTLAGQKQTAATSLPAGAAHIAATCFHPGEAAPNGRKAGSRSTIRTQAEQA